MCQRYMDQLPLSHPRQNLAHNPGMCPDWELNQQPFGSQASAQSTEPHQPRQPCLLIISKKWGKNQKRYWPGLAINSQHCLSGMWVPCTFQPNFGLHIITFLAGPWQSERLTTLSSCHKHNFRRQWSLDPLTYCILYSFFAWDKWKFIFYYFY